MLFIEMNLHFSPCYVNSFTLWLNMAKPQCSFGCSLRESSYITWQLLRTQEAPSINLSSTYLDGVSSLVSTYYPDLFHSWSLFSISHSFDHFLASGKILRSRCRYNLLWNWLQSFAVLLDSGRAKNSCYNGTIKLKE